MDNLRDKVHKWAGGKLHKMLQSLTINTNERRSVSTLVLEVKSFSSFTEASSQSNNGSQTGAVPKTLKNKTNTNKKRNNVSSSFADLTKKSCKTLSDVKSSDNTKVKYQSAVNSLQKHKRSQSCSNVSTNRPNISTRHNVLSTPRSIEQRKKLLKWLADKNKPLNTCSNLQCFNTAGKQVLHQSRKQIGQTKIKNNWNDNINEIYPRPHPYEKEEANDFGEENKENPCSTPPEYKAEALDKSELVNFIREALIELRSLVKAGYNRDECDAWIHVLRNHFPKIYEFLEYWECLASLEEARGVSYQRAVVRGAEDDNINEQLDGLLSKMSHLSLETPHKGRKATSPRNEVDVKNIFKSKAIQFALQQKAVKKLSTDLGENNYILYVATPVRRSTRRNVYDPKCVLTLDDIEPEKKCLTEFQPNPAFH